MALGKRAYIMDALYINYLIEFPFWRPGGLPSLAYALCLRMLSAEQMRTKRGFFFWNFHFASIYEQRTNTQKTEVAFQPPLVSWWRKTWQWSVYMLMETLSKSSMSTICCAIATRVFPTASLQTKLIGIGFLPSKPCFPTVIHGRCLFGLEMSDSRPRGRVAVTPNCILLIEKGSKVVINRLGSELQSFSVTDESLTSFVSK